MTTGDVDNPRIWAGADVYVAPVGSTAPTDTTTAWAAAWKAAGLLGEDGVELGSDADSKDHYAYGGIKIRRSRSKFSKTMKFVALEDNPVVFDLVNPGSTAASDEGVTTRTVKIPVPNPKAFGLQTVDGGITRRIVIPRGEVTEVADVEISDDELSAFEMTVEMYADDDGVFYLEITDDPQAVVT